MCLSDVVEKKLVFGDATIVQVKRLCLRMNKRLMVNEAHDDASHVCHRHVAYYLFPGEWFRNPGT